MNSHLKNFYPDDVLNESGGSGAGNKSATGDSLNINNSLTNSFSNSPGQSGGGALSTDSAEYDRKISLLTKKLRSYEKRRHKLVYESKQEQAASNTNQQQQSQSQPQQQQQQTQSTEQQQAENKVKY